MIRAPMTGAAIGAMTDMLDNTIPYGRTAEEIVRDAVADYGYPVCFSAPFGHIGTENCALPLGQKITLSVTPSGSTMSVMR